MSNPCAGLPTPSVARALRIYAAAHPGEREVDWEAVARIARQSKTAARKQDQWREEQHHGLSDDLCPRGAT